MSHVCAVLERSCTGIIVAWRLALLLTFLTLVSHWTNLSKSSFAYKKIQKHAPEVYPYNRNCIDYISSGSSEVPKRHVQTHKVVSRPFLSWLSCRMPLNPRGFILFFLCSRRCSGCFVSMMRSIYICSLHWVAIIPVWLLSWAKSLVAFVTISVPRFIYAVLSYSLTFTVCAYKYWLKCLRYLIIISA